MRVSLLAVAALFALTACGGQAEDAAGPAKPTTSVEDAYLAEVRESVPAYEVEPNKDMWLERGWDACKAIAEDGMDDDTLAGSWANLQGISKQDAVVGVRAAKAHLCD